MIGIIIIIAIAVGIFALWVMLLGSAVGSLDGAFYDPVIEKFRSISRVYEAIRKWEEARKNNWKERHRLLPPPQGWTPTEQLQQEKHFRELLVR